MLLLLPMTAAQHLFMLITTVLHIIFFVTNASTDDTQLCIFFCFEDNITCIMCSEDAEICLCCKIVLPHLECVHKCFFCWLCVRILLYLVSCTQHTPVGYIVVWSGIHDCKCIHHNRLWYNVLCARTNMGLGQREKLVTLQWEYGYGTLSHSTHCVETGDKSRSWTVYNITIFHIDIS